MLMVAGPGTWGRALRNERVGEQIFDDDFRTASAPLARTAWLPLDLRLGRPARATDPCLGRLGLRGWRLLLGCPRYLVLFFVRWAELALGRGAQAGLSSSARA
jgi:hypothetical protein